MSIELKTTIVPSPQVIDAAGAKQLIDTGGTTAIDVRTKPEIDASGCLSGAREIDFSAPDFAEKIAALPRNEVYLIYCQSGIRGLRTGLLMEKFGFVHVFILEGGMNAWLRAGLPILHEAE